jgi:Flp pilus assembly protein TadD
MGRYRYELILAGLVVLTWAVYGQVVGFEFVGIDDPGYVADNERVLAGWSVGNFGWAFTTLAQSNWHPLTWISLMLDAWVGGGQPAVFHLTSLLLHIANTLLLFHVLWRMTGAEWRSAIVAALFAVHPLHVESVAWVAERKDVLSTLFWLLAVWAWIGYVERPGVKRYARVVLAMVGGLLAKPMLVTLPVVLLLLDYWPLRRFAPGRGERGAALRRPWGALFDKIPLAALAAASSAITLHAQSAGGAVGSLELFPLGARVGNALLSYVRYIVMMIRPTGLAIPYPYDLEALTPLRVGGAAILLAAISWLVLRSTRSRPYLLVGWGWYLVTLVPVIGVVQVGGQAMADRYTYVPLTGLFVMVVWGVSDWVAPRSARVHLAAGVAASGIVLALALTARGQVGHWRDTTALFTRALAVTRNNAVAHNALGLELYKQGRLEEAIEHYRKAIEISPIYMDARVNIAAALMQDGRDEEAMQHYRAAMRLSPGEALIPMNLAVALMDKGRLDEAAELFRQVLERQPDDPSAHGALGVVLARQGRYGEAIAHFRRSVDADPSDAEMRVNLGTALLKQEAWQDARAQLTEAIRLDPANLSAHKNLGVLLARQGRLVEARKHLEEAARLAPDDEGARKNLERVKNLIQEGAETAP